MRSARSTASRRPRWAAVRLVTAVVTGLSCLWALPVDAASRPSGDPVSQVKAATSRLADIAKQASEQAAMTAAMEAVMAEVVDFEGFSARSLKGAWAGLKPAQQARFVAAFRGLVMGTYAGRFKPGANFRVSYRGETTYTEAPLATVRTTIHGEKAAADVDYLFAAVTVGKGTAWRAVDIVIDEVSMARNWRGQFKRILARDGFDALIARIEKKAAKR